MSELIRKKDALDALMAERKHLLDKGRWGAEHILTHHGYNVIDELPPVQEIIHCEECVYKKICSWKNQGATFCSFGERGKAE